MSERASAREGGQEGGRDGGESMLSVERARSRAREKVPAYQRLTAVRPIGSGISCSSFNPRSVSSLSDPSSPIRLGSALSLPHHAIVKLPSTVSLTKASASSSSPSRGSSRRGAMSRGQNGALR